MAGLARRIWRLLPRSFRHQVFTHATALTAPREARNHPAAAPISVIGFLKGTTGLGEGARLQADALAAWGHAPLIHPVTGPFGQDDLPDTALTGSPLPEVPGPGTALIHLNPHMLPLGLRLTGRARLQGRRIVGYWAWELPRMPKAWKLGLPFVDEVWAPSRFTADAIRPFTDKPVHVVPHPVALPYEGQDIPGRVDRGGFGLPDSAFITLVMFHMGSSFERKNPLGAIRAFKQAFGADPSRLLVVKAADMDSYPDAAQTLMQAIGEAPNIRIMPEKLSRERIRDLVRSVDCVLSLHRSEGFGLVLAEAMVAARPVVATAWSANLDFMSEQTACMVPCGFVPVVDPQENYTEPDQHWAAPDEQAAAAHLVA
ncbi:MAG: glycosyltransferase, partial [Rhodospirillaceae bacterium]